MNHAEHIAQLRESATASRAEAAKQAKAAATYQAKADAAAAAAANATELADGWDEIADLLEGSAVDEAEQDRQIAADDAARAGEKEDEGLALDTAAAARVHYTDPRVRDLAEARWRLESGGTRAQWLALGKNDARALITDARDWIRAAVAAGILPPHGQGGAP